MASPVTLTDATGTGITVIAAEPVFPSLVAEMVAVPTATLVTTPLASTEATDGVDELHDTARPVSTAPADVRNSAVALALCPNGIVGGDSATVIVDNTGAGGATGPSVPPPPHAVITVIISTAIATRCISLSVDCHHGTVIRRGDKVGEGSDRPAFAAGRGNARDGLVTRVAYAFSMPTVLRVGPYRCFFYAGDRAEPAHVHVERDHNRAKIWLAPVRLQESGSFPRGELARIVMTVREHAIDLQRSWDDYFAD